MKKEQDLTTITTGTRIGFLGGGQLARMSAYKAFELGLEVGLFSGSTAREPLENATPFVVKSDFSDVDALIAFADSCDVVTLENEFIDATVLRAVEQGSKTPLFPSAISFARIENKYAEKKTFRDAGIPVTPFARVQTVQDVLDFAEQEGWPCVIKSSKGGYDGYGNVTIQMDDEVEDAFCSLGGNRGHEIVAETFIPFERELAVMVARNATGHVVYPCVETIQVNHICKEVIAPARVSPELSALAQRLALKATEVIDGVGIFAYEFFLTQDGRLLLNESAPRPHNSGHYTMEACQTSQFENHIRAILGLPLGASTLRRPAAVMINLLGTHKRPAELTHHLSALKTEDGHLHIYGKTDSKPGRKMGHFTLLGDDVEEVLERARRVTKEMEI